MKDYAGRWSGLVGRDGGASPRLLIVTTVPGTIRGFLAPFARHFRSLGWRVDAMARQVSACPECGDAFDRVWDVDWSRNPLEPRNLLGTPAVIRGIVQQERYDLVHVHTPVAAFVTRFALRGLRKRGKPVVIYTAHGFHFHAGGSPYRNAVFLNLERLAGGWTDYLVVINRDDEAAARNHKLTSPDHICYMPGIGVDTAYYSPDNVAASDVERVYADIGLSPEEALFVMAAEFNPGKRHRDAIAALARLNRRNVRLAFAGAGPLVEEMKRVATEMGVDGQVHFLGYRRDIPALVRSSVAVLLPSAREGLPRCVMESLCLERPVIGSRIRGTRDLLGDGAGLLVNVGDIDGLAAAMGWIVDHPVEAREMGRRGRRQMGAYDLRHIIRLHEELYGRALSGPRSY